MRKKNKIIRFTALILVFAFIMCFAAACGGNTVKVTYDYNYDGAPDAVVKTIEESDVAEEPEDPERERYEFTGWYTTAACTKKFDFEEALYEDVTIYAGWNQVTALVTFDYNYDGAEDTVQEVSIGKTVSQPTDPSRDGYLFTSWYTAESCTAGTEYDFSSTVSGDMTISAGWEQSSGNTVTITYMWNYDGAPDDGVCNKTTIESNTKTTSYKATRENYYLAGWYTDAECTESFNFGNRVTSSVTLYARWFYINTFEAEYLDLTGINGNTYSGGAGGTSLVKRDTLNLNASNGFYLNDLYATGLTLTYNITSDAAVDDAVIVLRLGAEYYDVTLTSETFLVQVNGTNLTYDTITLSNVPSYTSGQKLAFEDFTISVKVSLQQGDNVIKLVVNNSDRMGGSSSGTMEATAPMIDCMYIYTDATLSWNPKTDNTNNK